MRFQLNVTVTIIPSMLHVYSFILLFIYHQCHITIAVDTVIKQYTHLLVLGLFAMQDCPERSDMYVIAVVTLEFCLASSAEGLWTSKLLW